MALEIERKFLIRAFPDGLPLLERAVLAQGYLSTDPVTVRIRRKQEEGKPDKFVLCFKSKGGLIRQETELDIVQEVFDELAALLTAPLIVKERRIYALEGGQRLECNAVDGDTSHGFWYAEVEFPDEAAARAFVPPACVGREVTDDARFGMAKYWKDRQALCALWREWCAAQDETG